MGIKFNLKLKDLKLEYFISYLAPVLKYFRPREKIASYEDLSNFIKKKVCLDNSSNFIFLFKN